MHSEIGCDRLIILISLHTDVRVVGWPLMASPQSTLALIAVYLLVCYVGPKLMQSRKAWDLKKFIVLYNLALVGLSLYMFLEVRLDWNQSLLND